MENQTNSHSELDAIKNEITTKTSGERKSLPWSSIIITVILGTLTIFSVAQMASSVYVFNKLKSGNLGPSTSGDSSGNSIQSAPAMVGGC